uniref:3-phosphoinositide-dependent protein kinase B n=1 Tax=Erigeron canadensis TaxID=72917 RepID=UPI001CB8B573|nr:3-phosphoinositide-dependent protein kinase B [Erigeron canadensis]
MGEKEEVKGGGGGGGNPNYTNNDNNSNNNNNNEKDKSSSNNLHKLLNEKGAAATKGKSCKGCLYYSSTLKSNSRNPVCVGFTRSLPKVPRYYVGESEMEASKEGRSLADFRYGCVGYSVYSDMKSQPGNEDTQKELPVCVGIEVLVDRKPTNAISAPTHAHSKDNHAIPQPRVNKPTQSASDDFFSRFTRNANVVASGVAKNVRKVGNQIKDSVEDVLYPYRRRPK